jgi:breast cancer 2 susceptibility protein
MSPITGDVGGVDGMEQFPVSQAGSGRAVSISMASVQKANDVLEKNNIKIGNIDSCTI